MRSRAAPQRSANTAQLSRLADMAADRAVQRTFTALGVDISTPGAVIEAQELFLSLRNLKRDWTLFRNRLIMAGGTLIASAVGAWIMGYLPKAPPPPL